MTKFLGLSRPFFIALVMVVVLVPPAGAYINGGIHHSTLKTYEKQLRAAGWEASFGQDLPATLPDKDALQRSVNQLVGQALHTFSEEDAAKVSPQTKREIARLTREAIEEANKGRRQTIKTGKTGSLRYQVGVLRYESYYVVKSGVDRGIRGRSSGLVPFVALMPADRVRSAEARITVFVPADAEVFFERESTTQRGRERLYLTPPLTVGENYQYEIRARWQDRGKTIERSRKISLTGGDSIRVNFLTEE